MTRESVYVEYTIIIVVDVLGSADVIIAVTTRVTAQFSPPQRDHHTRPSVAKERAKETRVRHVISGGAAACFPFDPG